MSLRDLSDRELRERAGAKWTAAGPDVLPAWVAEMDFALAEPIAGALHDAIDRGAVGYSPSDARTGVPEALATFAADRWSWALDPAHVVLVPDVMSGIELVLRTLCEDAPVVVPTPAYPPFLDVVPLTGRTLVPLPLSPDGPAVLDLDRLDAALAAARAPCCCASRTTRGGACSPGVSWRACATWSCGTGHASSATRCTPPWCSRVPPTCPTPPWTAPRRTPRRSCRRPRRGTCPGCGVPRWSRAPRRTRGILRALPLVAVHGPSPLGVVGALAAYREGTPWLEELRRRLDGNRTLFAELVDELLPQVRRRRLEATYLAWLDVRGLGLQDPAGLALRDGRVLVNDGTRFGPGGAGHVRVNLATSPDRLDRIVRRLASAWTPPPHR